MANENLKFTISRDQLKSLVEEASGPIDPRPERPIMQTLLFTLKPKDAKKGYLFVVGADTSTEIENQGEVEVADLKGEVRFSILAKTIGQVADALSLGASIDFELDIKNEQAKIHCGKTHYDIRLHNAEHFTRLEEKKTEAELTLSISELKEIVEKTKYAAAKPNEFREVMRNVLLKVETDHLETIATDGVRLAAISKKTKNKNQNALQVLLPERAVGLLQSFLTDIEAVASEEEKLGFVKMKISEDQIEFVTNSWDLKVLRGQGSFPDYERILPKTEAASFLTSTPILKETLARMNPINSDVINFEFSKEGLDKAKHLYVYSENDRGEKCEDTIEGNYEGEKKNVTFKPQYLLDALNAISVDKIKLCFYKESAMIRVLDLENDQDYHIFMPLFG